MKGSANGEWRVANCDLFAARHLLFETTDFSALAVGSS
jgi:hypothetical protein